VRRYHCKSCEYKVSIRSAIEEHVSDFGCEGYTDIIKDKI
jgi:hypothetical protein